MAISHAPVRNPPPSNAPILVARSPTNLVSSCCRRSRNAFLPAVPRSIEPRYPLVEDRQLAHDVTVVVGTKDSITPTLSQISHLATALPRGVRVIYTYPRPPWGSEDAAEYARSLRAAAGPHLGERFRLLEVKSFSNPFDAWLKALPLVRTKYTLLMHNDVFLLDKRGHFLSELHGALEAHPQHAVRPVPIAEMNRAASAAIAASTSATAATVAAAAATARRRHCHSANRESTALTDTRRLARWWRRVHTGGRSADL